MMHTSAPARCALSAFCQKVHAPRMIATAPPLTLPTLSGPHPTGEVPVSSTTGMPHRGAKLAAPNETSAVAYETVSAPPAHDTSASAAAQWLGSTVVTVVVVIV